MREKIKDFFLFAFNILLLFYRVYFYDNIYVVLNVVHSIAH